MHICSEMVSLCLVVLNFGSVHVSLSLDMCRLYLPIPNQSWLLRLMPNLAMFKLVIKSDCERSL